MPQSSHLYIENTTQAYRDLRRFPLLAATVRDSRLSPYIHVYMCIFVELTYFLQNTSVLGKEHGPSSWERKTAPAMSCTTSNISFMLITLRNMLGLSGGAAITSGLSMCKMELAASNTNLLAVAVRASTCRYDGIMLFSSPSLKSSRQKDSPLVMQGEEIKKH